MLSNGPCLQGTYSLEKEKEKSNNHTNKSKTANTMGSLKETQCYDNPNREFNLVKGVGKSSMGKRRVKDKELTKYVSNKPFIIGFF